MISVLGDQPEVLKILRNQNYENRPVVEAYKVALRLLELFGQRYAKVIAGKVQQKKEFIQVYQACAEIQEKVESGDTDYVQMNWPKTHAVLQKYPLSLKLMDIFMLIKRISYSFWPFPQKILQFAKPELETMQILENERRDAFYILLSELNRPKVALEVLEHKGDFPPEIRQIKPLPPEKEMALTKFYFGGGALVYKERTVYFSEMVQMWATLSLENRQRHLHLLERMTLRDWVSDEPNLIMDFLQFDDEKQAPQLTFQEFLARSSALALQSNLGLQFWPGVSAKIVKMFIDFNLAIEDDLSYLSAFRNFYEIKYNRSSTPLIRSFHLHSFLTTHFGISQDDFSALLNTVVFRRERVNQQEIPGFDQRNVAPESVASFQAAWAGFRKIVNTIAGKEDAPIRLEDEELINDSSAWDLLFFLWQHNRRGCFIDLLCAFAKKKNFTMTLSTAYEFCIANEAEMTLEKSQNLIEVYDLMSQRFVMNNVNFQRGEAIFFTPPLHLTAEMIIVLGFAGERTDSFIQNMAAYPFAKELEYCQMLRQHILMFQPVKFELLKDCETIGAKPSEDLLFDLLSKPLAPFDPALQADQQQLAKALTRKIQDRYCFSDVEIFSIYIEILRLVARNETAQILKISQAVHDLASLCPTLTNEIIYYLFRYHPDITPKGIAQLADLREEWAKNNAQLGRFVISQEIYDNIIAKIDVFVSPLSKASLEMGLPFFVKCQRALLSAFFPPLQPLTNFLHVTNVTVQGIRWGQPVWKTHEGQLSFILKQAKVGIYFNWSIWKDYPVFFLSFYNVATGTAFSAFIPINVSASAIATEQIRKPFWGLLGTLGQIVLREQPDADIPLDAPETPKSWMPAFVGAKETIQNFREVRPQWEFYKKVKLSYRELFLCSVGVRKLPDFPSYKSLDIAAQGHIFSSHPRGALLPQAILLLQESPQHFIPDAEEVFVRNCRALFNKSTQQATPLNLHLHTLDGNLPISYHVQTVDEFVGENLQENQNEVAATQDEIQGKYINLSIDGIRIPLRYPPGALQDDALFQKYFDYHNLLLKGAYYFTESL